MKTFATLSTLGTSLVAAGAALFAFSAPAHAAADLELWRLDCGSVVVKDLSFFSDTFAYKGESRTLTDSCYVIRHGADYLLWDTGLPAALIGKAPDLAQPLAPSLTVDIPTQLAKIGLKPDQIGLVGISHNHFDHLGQATTFPKATLMIGAGDWESLHENPLPFGVMPALVQPWMDGKAKVDPVSGDRDVFGDGSVTMLAMPGHTKGETALLVKLPQSGPVLLSGDVVHFEEQIANNGVPPFNIDRAESLASMERLNRIAKQLNAKLVVQHDANDIGKLPAFPASAR
ncbi:N-acyl homoserine lactonase family protein [Neorhizobium galegae]|uniref:N-acyl homoserine lactonase family protein n=1 Tax=Neorhizobium galegae TaxID=399 RepID=UPI000620F8E8|nr:N-acyl homoserine lactonase family protein [Neorhizobium galegae]CDZ25201.1 AttM/AiiB family protein [Neorhizobium galegae bv. officinalis]KAA9387923.1 N-acyl homoserine lactonase family protein [Neorhizobium galegae]KAB1115606.1 N-acyl homoserine lactonase family protein [Neorhizobium galegae]MCM2501609.1 N-acyl homoserine lactonase family protein [Neorhizobium galegae]MCQ1774111.1 N-acyl homoserine lactonase family protein [Neorhizobium galegae]